MTEEERKKAWGAVLALIDAHGRNQWGANRKMILPMLLAVRDTGAVPEEVLIHPICHYGDAYYPSVYRVPKSEVVKKLRKKTLARLEKLVEKLTRYIGWT